MNALDRSLGVDVFNSVGGAAYFERLVREWESQGFDVKKYQAVSDSFYRLKKDPAIA